MTVFNLNRFLVVKINVMYCNVNTVFHCITEFIKISVS